MAAKVDTLCPGNRRVYIVWGVANRNESEIAPSSSLTGDLVKAGSTSAVSGSGVGMK
jgi:hypothetical protein